ncbi:MAG: hypothetical protein KAI44_05670, partial [Methylococcales bacterium]|nr:hypothetical protein [Methylococcales bacterium]
KKPDCFLTFGFFYVWGHIPVEAAHAECGDVGWVECSDLKSREMKSITIEFNIHRWVSGFGYRPYFLPTQQIMLTN